jgi:hypothetical protein
LLNSLGNGFSCTSNDTAQILSRFHDEPIYSGRADPSYIIENIAGAAGLVKSAAISIYDVGLSVKSLLSVSTPQLTPFTAGSYGLVGTKYENFIQSSLGGSGSFKAGGREFDGAIGNQWYEAKSGNYWNDVTSSPQGFAKFRSDMGQRQDIANKNGATFSMYSNTSVPPNVGAWLQKMGINYTHY